MKKNTASKKVKRVFPESVRVYFPGEKNELLREIEKIAHEINMPVSALCVNLIKMSLPTMQHYADALKGEGEQLREYTIKIEKAESKLITQQRAESIK